MRVYFKTYGCTLNKADTQIMKFILMEHGNLIVNSEEDADVIVLNTCGVKETTENKILYSIKKLDQNLSKFVVAGCLSANTKKIRAITNRPIMWPASVDRIVDAVNSAYLGIPNKEFKTKWAKDSRGIVNAGIITYIPISEGCTSACTYCFSRIARPLLKSYNPKWIVEMVRDAVLNGSREIEITSMDTGAYGIDIGTNLVDLLRMVLSVNGDFKVRVGMINPQHVKKLLKKLVEIYKNPKMFKFLHAPVQTGSEKVCGEMNRPHTVQDFVNIVRTFREEIPNITISTDIIVAYPTETEKDFENTLNLIRGIKPDVVNISRYSIRPGTKSSQIKQPTTQVKKDRSRRLSRLVKRIEGEVNRKYLGKDLNVIILSRKQYAGKNQYVCRSNNYKQVILETDDMLKIGSHIKINVYDISSTTLFGSIC